MIKSAQLQKTQTIEGNVGALTKVDDEWSLSPNLLKSHRPLASVPRSAA
jgi:hypothetical protein